MFGAEGAELQQLRELLPQWVTLGSRLTPFPTPKRGPGRWGPWARLAGYRRDYDGLIDKLIDRARRDPHLAERPDVLSLFLRSTYDDGTAMSRDDIGDELLALLAAGHETTASTLGWAFERISRHPDVLDRLVAEAAGEDNTYRQATIFEVQRNRTVIDFAGRHVAAPIYELGPWRIPEGYSILISLLQLHLNPEVYPEPERFDPQRFIDAKPSTFAWVPFGGGTRRCVGAAFANMELDVVLRTVLRHVVIQTTDAPGEKVHNRGVAFTPKKGGRVVVYRRPDAAGLAGLGVGQSAEPRFLRPRCGRVAENLQRERLNPVVDLVRIVGQRQDVGALGLDLQRQPLGECPVFDRAVRVVVPVPAELHGAQPLAGRRSRDDVLDRVVLVTVEGADRDDDVDHDLRGKDVNESAGHRESPQGQAAGLFLGGAQRWREGDGAHGIDPRFSGLDS